MTFPKIRASTLVVIPVRNPAHSKIGTGCAVSLSQRSTLTTHLFLQTLTRLQMARPRNRFDIAVMTRSHKIRRIADHIQAYVIFDWYDGLAQAAHKAQIWAKSTGYRHLCILPSDLADPDPAELTTLLNQATDVPNVTLCPSKDMGTQAMLLPVDRAMAFAYGPNSISANFVAARAAEMTPVVLSLDSLCKEVDTEADLEELSPEARSIIEAKCPEPANLRSAPGR